MRKKNVDVFRSKDLNIFKHANNSHWSIKRKEKIRLKLPNYKYHFLSGGGGEFQVENVLKQSL